MAARIRPPKNPVTLTLDGKTIVAERGEPVAAALVSAGHLALARSPKFHRPRGPSCLRGACDGCLARVNEVPNVMTCLVPAEEGLRVATQNTLGPRDVDFLRMTDWFFPEGMNHHELFAGVPGVQSVMQAFARRVAGLGKLPKEIAAPRASLRREVDVLVVGAGASGMATALVLQRSGRKVSVIDEGLAPGGSLLALSGDLRESFGAVSSEFEAAIERGSIEFRSRTIAGGVYGDDVLVVGTQGAEIVTARAVVFATGAHDGVLAFEGNDVPGVLSARAAGLLLGLGVLVGQKVVVVVSEGGGPFGEAFAVAARTADLRANVTLVFGEPLAVEGASRAKGVRVNTAEGERAFEADAVVLDAPRSPAYELAAQAGAMLAHEARGFVVRTDRGAIREGVFAVGEVAGVALEANSIRANAEEVAAAIART